MALHHLPSISHLERCFSEIRRILRPGGALYLVDFGRLKSLKSVIYFAYMNEGNQPHIFSLDYERSLRAAFLPDDFKKLAAEVFGSSFLVSTTSPVPILVLIRSDRRDGVSGELKERLQRMRLELPSRYRNDLDLIRRLFRLGGLEGDPFA